ncbi:MAG: arylesterase [Gemmatimonadetes bacterium]|nr:arylesterase [Gemmatimonadota bacterium]
MRRGLSVVVLAAACGTATKDTVRTDSAGVTQPNVGVAAPAPVRKGTVLLVGTSLTAGYGLDNPDDAYPSVLQRMADSAGYSIAIQNAGLSGETSAGALRRIDWLLRDDFTAVVIETGANDGLRGLDVDSTRANLKAIVRRVKSELPNARVALVQMEAPPNLGARYTTAFRESFGEVAREEGITLFPFLLDGVGGVAGLNQRDGIHPNVEGAQRVARNLWPALEALLAGTAAGR